MASLAVEETSEEEALSVLEELRIEIFGNEYLYFYILQFIYLDAMTICNIQLTCNANRNWNKKVLKDFEWKWRWEKIEEFLGKELTDKMKQGADFKGNLYLENKGLNDEGCRHLAPALVEMTGLKELWLGENQIGDHGMEYLCRALPEMTALNVLGLDGNQIGDQGMEYLCRALPKLTALNGLDLNRYQIGDQGMNYLCRALPKLTALKALYLGGNQIGENAKSKFKEEWKKAGKVSGKLYI